MEDLVKRQLQLEHEGVQMGIQRYRNQIAKKDPAEHKPETVLLQRCLPQMTQAIDTYKNTVVKGKQPAARELLKSLKASSEEVAYLTLRVCFSGGYNQQMTNLAEKIAFAILDQHEYLKFKEEHPRYVNVLMGDLKKATSQRHRRTVIMVKKRKMGVLDTEVSKDDRLLLGFKLIDILVSQTGLFQKSKIAGVFHITMAEETIKWITDKHLQCELMAPFWLPMVVPPKKWTRTSQGGYLSNDLTKRATLVRMGSKAQLEMLQEETASMVLDTVNRLQETPWKINRRVFEVLEDVWASGGVLGDLPSAELEELPPKPWKDDSEFNWLKAHDPETVTAWKRSALEVYEKRVKENSKRCQVGSKLMIGRMFLNDTIYYPHSMDFRGRIYPIPTCGGLQPQGDDLGKALLQFAEGKPLGESGVFWLAVHGANSYGFDKAPLEDRFQWVKDHEEMILDCANNPLDGSRAWADADSPYCFLAFCFEWAGVMKEGVNWVSHLPVGMDGSCNGLQHFSAMLRDEVGGSAVNLIPGEKPSDIYSRVAEHVSRIVEREAAAGDENAKLWVGKIDRKMAKRNVMTLPYGAKKYGFKDQLIAELNKREERYLDTDDYFAPAVYLADRMYNGIGDIVIAARNAMDWLQEVAKVVSKTGNPVSWTTPAGFKAVQDYRVMRGYQIDLMIGSVRIKPVVKVPTEKLDSRKCASAIAPNVVHSFDAAHLMRTVEKMAAEGITSYAMIHDSYGTLAADVETMNRCLREAFVEQYQGNVLERFRNEILEQLPEELHDKVPPVPPMGKLDLEAVKLSRYFFA